MANLDVSTLDSGTPRSLDGRTYPERLRPYERFDRDLLPVVAEGGAVGVDDLAVSGVPYFSRSLALRWMQSAEWRGLLERRAGRSRSYALTERGQRALHKAA